jgi:hypothetical protein
MKFKIFKICFRNIYNEFTGATNLSTERMRTVTVFSESTFCSSRSVIKRAVLFDRLRESAKSTAIRILALYRLNASFSVSVAKLWLVFTILTF